jgi:hypothetical protein
MKAAENGLPIDTGAPRWCKILSAGHGKPYLLRYPKNDNGIVFPSEGLQGLRQLLATVAAALHLDGSGNALPDTAPSGTSVT